MEYKCFERVTDQEDIYRLGGLPTDNMAMSDENLRLNICATFILWLIQFQPGIKSIGDFGCGNGGLMGLLKQRLPNMDIYGYDYCKGNVEDAMSKGLPVELKDIFGEDVRFPNILILAEFLEHLESPHSLLEKIPVGTFIVATVPNHETLEKHGYSHLWVWTDYSFADMFRKYGFEILQKGDLQKSQIVVAKKVRVQC